MFEKLVIMGLCVVVVVLLSIYNIQTVALSSGYDYSISEIKEIHNNLMSEFHGVKLGLIESSLEGYSTSCGQKLQFHRIIVRQRICQEKIQVCEIGFNLGHSAITWLTAAPNVHLQSFDLGEHKYAKFGAEFVKNRFKNRFNITFGNSIQTVPGVPNLKCDIFMVDGGHSYEVATADLNNAVHHIVPGGVLLIDDTNCRAGYCVDRAWKDFLGRNQNILIPSTTIEYIGPSECQSGISGAFIIE